MKKYIYRLIADYYYKKASNYEHLLKTMHGRKDWMKYIANTGSIFMRKEYCLGKALYFIEKALK